MLTQCRLSLLAILCGCAAVLAVVPARAVSVQAVSTTFSGDPSAVDIELTESGGDIIVTLSVVRTVNHGDLRAVYLNIEDDSLLPGLTATGQYVTDFEIHTFNLGGNTNLSGPGSPCPCDIGVELGTPGSGGDDIHETSFTISHATLNLQLVQFTAQAFGIQVGSVGPEECFDGAAKLAGVFPVAVPEPASGALTALGLGLLSLAMRSRR